MPKQPTSVRLPDLTTRQLSELIARTGMTQSEIISTAIDRMYRQEIGGNPLSKQQENAKT